MREKLLNFLKFLFFIFLIPVLVATTLSFRLQLQTIEGNFRDALLGGVYLYLIMHLFFYEPVDFYHFGQGLIAGLCKFSEPLAIVIKYILPFYTLVASLVYYFVVTLSGAGGIWPYFILALVGFTMTMHVVLTAHNLHEEDAASIKPHYFSAMSLTYIANMILLASFLDLIFEKFSLPEFFFSLFDISRVIYSHAWHQLFVPST